MSEDKVLETQNDDTGLTDKQSKQRMKAFGLSTAIVLGTITFVAAILMPSRGNQTSRISDGRSPYTALDVGESALPIICSARAMQEANIRKENNFWTGIKPLFFRCQSGGKDITLSCGPAAQGDVLCNEYEPR